MMRKHDQWVTPLAYSSLICSSSCPDRYITSTNTFLRSSYRVPSTSSLLTKLAILSCSYRFSNIFLGSSVSSPVLLLTSMILACPLPESMMKLQSFFSFLQISLASPTRMVSSQSLSFLARISVSFSFTSCFHCLQVALVRLSLKSPKLLFVLTRESLPFWAVLQLVLSYCCAACRERKLEILPSTFLHVYTLRSRLSRLTNSTHSLSNCRTSYALMIKPPFSASPMNSSRVRQSLLVRQNAMRSMLLWAAKSSRRWKSRSSPSVSSDIINLSINPIQQPTLHLFLISSRWAIWYVGGYLGEWYNLNNWIVVCIQMDAQGTIKLMDGLYVGDESSARDEQLILLNRVAVVLNLTSLPNYFLHYGVIYPQMQWPNADPKDITEAIIHAKQSGQSVLIHGEGNLDAAVGAGALFLMERQVCEYEERFRWSLFKTLEFVASRVEGLAFSEQSFELLKRHELSLLNEEVRLSYNWEQRPTDADELILRNTYLNSTQKQKIAVSTPIKPKIKEKRRISWMISAPQEIKAVKQPPKTKDVSLSIRNQVLMSVRKILNKQESTYGGNSSNMSDQKGLPLKKYKSTYTLASLSSIQRMQKLQQIPVVSLNLTEHNENKPSKSQITIKRVKTEGSEAITTRTSQPQIVISLKKDSEKKVLTHRRASDSLKKLRQTQYTRKISTNYQNLR